MRRLLSCTKDLDDEDKGFYLTLAAHKQIQTMKSWAWSTVLVYMCKYT